MAMALGLVKAIIPGVRRKLASGLAGVLETLLYGAAQATAGPSEAGRTRVSPPALLPLTMWPEHSTHPRWASVSFPSN